MSANVPWLRNPRGKGGVEVIDSLFECKSALRIIGDRLPGKSAFAKATQVRWETNRQERNLQICPHLGFRGTYPGVDCRLPFRKRDLDILKTIEMSLPTKPLNPKALKDG